MKPRIRVLRCKQKVPEGLSFGYFYDAFFVGYVRGITLAEAIRCVLKFVRGKT